MKYIIFNPSPHYSYLSSHYTSLLAINIFHTVILPSISLFYSCSVYSSFILLSSFLTSLLFSSFRCTAEPFLPPPVFLQDIIPGAGPGNSPRAGAGAATTATSVTGKSPGEVSLCLAYLFCIYYSTAIEYCTHFTYFLF